ncbi:hypothetical protein BDF22DRAFT_749236 [Syncephalis plumigaleata]|nr:hypothetical protein BDF22DRAFT_749236 [Syncephalis plumigaleata]
MTMTRSIVSSCAYSRLSITRACRNLLPRTSIIPAGRTRIALAAQTGRAFSIASLWGSGKTESKLGRANNKSPLLQLDDLFHPLVSSPFRDLKERGEATADHGVCPGCLTEAGIPNATGIEAHCASRKPSFTCPDCGFPTHCSREHWELDREEHQKVCKVLRQVNEDEHDLRSGRRLLEFEYPGPQGFEEAVNLSNWDTFFYTRNFPSLNEERFLRHASKPLTYPITIASILHDTSPYTSSKELTGEGIKSLIALRTTLATENAAQQSADAAAAAKFPRPLRVFMPGARAESQLPVEAWMQLLYLFPNTTFHLHFIGPEVRPPPSLVKEMGKSDDTTTSKPIEDTTGQVYHPPVTITPTPNLILTWHNSEYNMRVHQGLAPFDLYRDVFFYFCPGFGHPQQRAGWHDAVRMAIRTQCAMFVTGFDAADIQQDCGCLAEDHDEEMDWLMRPTLNRFRSLKPDIFLGDVRQHIYTNWSIYGVRGKRYEVKYTEEEEEEGNNDNDNA